jgi:hypothetical protein
MMAFPAAPDQLSQQPVWMFAGQAQEMPRYLREEVVSTCLEGMELLIHLVATYRVKSCGRRVRVAHQWV